MKITNQGVITKYFTYERNMKIFKCKSSKIEEKEKSAIKNWALGRNLGRNK